MSGQVDDLWRDFTSLRLAWGRRREAAGGLNALAGFDFQCAAALLAAAENFAQGGRSVLVEALSDLTAFRNGAIVTTQAKRTLTSGALQSALKELWSIDRLAASEVPFLAPKLQFEVLSRRRELKDIEGAIARWTPDETHLESDLLAFKNRVSVTIQSDPRLSLAAYLVDTFGVATPTEVVDELVGLVMRNLSERGVDALADEIELRFRAFEVGAADRLRQFYLWRPEDRPPTEVVYEANKRKAVLIGEIPKVEDLRGGRFADREIYAELEETASGLLYNDEVRSAGKFAVMWIGGRSGTGKSVALLHVLARLQEEDAGLVIIWLKRASERIADAVRWSRPFLTQGLQVVIAADDPYAPDRQQGLGSILDASLEAFEMAQEQYSDCHPPLLIFCGPDEQAEQFEDELGDRLHITRHDLPAETRDEITRLRNWYEQRTGVAQLPVGEDSDVLLVQLFFEWQTGLPIADFARSFRQRLQGMDHGVFDFVAAILALNRLYSVFPSQGLETERTENPGFAASLDRLTEMEGHFEIVPEESGIRFTHPHLADAIYHAWFGRPSDRVYRSAHLRKGILAAFEIDGPPQKRFAPLWAIARAAGGRHGETVRQRLELCLPELKDLLRSIFSEFISPAKLPLAELPVWIDLNRYLDLKLSPDPIESLTAAVYVLAPVEPRPTGLRLSCHKLLEESSNPHARGAVEHILQEHAGWHEWAAVLADYVMKCGPDRVATQLNQLIENAWWSGGCQRVLNSCLGFPNSEVARGILIKWLLTAPPKAPLWPDRFVGGFDHFKFPQELLDKGVTFLAQHNGHQLWSRVWGCIRKASPEIKHYLDRAALVWLRDAPAVGAGWSYMWVFLWDEGHKGLEILGIRWLQAVAPDHGYWQFVWQRLWSSEVADKALLRRLGHSWLDTVSPRHRSWSYVWHTLFEDASAKSSQVELLSQAQQWVHTVSIEHPGWAHVWGCLSTLQFGDREYLNRLAVHWLQHVHPDSSGWRRIWDTVRLEPAVDRALVRQIGLTWLSNADPSSQHWGFIWRELMNDPYTDHSHLTESALRWLGNVPAEHHSWQYVWQQLWEMPETDKERLRTLALKWLETTSPDHGSWGYVWSALRSDPHVDKSVLVALGMQWLTKASADLNAWALVWKNIWFDDRNSRKALTEIAILQLRSSLSLSSWFPEIWRTLWSDAERRNTELARLGVQWLQSYPAKHRRGPDICLQLWRYKWDEDELIPLTLLWIQKSGAGEPSSLLWHTALKTRSAKHRAQLIQLGLDWLNSWKAQWSVVWVTIWHLPHTERPSRKELAELGITWLEHQLHYKEGWDEVWMRVWEKAGRHQVMLHRVAMHLLSQTPAEIRAALLPKLPAVVRTAFKG